MVKFSRALAVAAVPLFFASITACEQVDSDVQAEPEVQAELGQVVDNPESGDAIALAVGETLTLTLDANVTTGYQWSVEVQPPNLLKSVSNEYLADPAPEGLVGSGGTRELVFAAQSAGSGELVLTFSRGPGDVFEVRTLDVSVK